MRGLGSQCVELFGRSEACVSGLHHELPFLEHMHEFHTSKGIPGGSERFEPEHGTGDALHCSMILLHHIVEIFHLADSDSRAVFLVVVPDRRRVGLAAINRDRLRDAMAADRLR
jgi:hypothetical protein